MYPLQIIPRRLDSLTARARRLCFLISSLRRIAFYPNAYLFLNDWRLLGGPLLLPFTCDPVSCNISLHNSNYCLLQQARWRYWGWLYLRQLKNYHKFTTTLRICSFYFAYYWTYGLWRILITPYKLIKLEAFSR
jgi:hypothetical protein